MRATEAGSHRASGHRIENVLLTEYQQFQSNMVLRPVPRYTLPRRMAVIGAGLSRFDGIQPTVLPLRSESAWRR